MLNQGFIYRETIDRRGAGRRLDAYLSERYRHTALAQWREHIAAGRVRIGGEVAAAGAILTLRDRVAWHRPPWEEPAAPLDIPVLYDHGGVLVVHKPSGLPTLPGGGFLEHTLMHQLRLVAPGASAVHRLGRWTSGAVVCARDPATAAALTAQFAARAVGKRYRALASGSPASPSFPVDAPIGPVPYPPLGTLHAAAPDGRPAHSHVTVLERRDGCFLADVHISTGRPHQIRIHLACAGHPLVGDPLYASGGLPHPGGLALPGDAGYLLHAAEVSLRHPTTGEPLTVHAPPPPTLRPGAPHQRRAGPAPA